MVWYGMVPYNTIIELARDMYLFDTETGNRGSFRLTLTKKLPSLFAVAVASKKQTMNTD